MSTFNHPLVAAVVPVFRARFLTECLDSIFFQSHQPDEVIVVDDGSPDQEQIVRSCARYDGRVRLLRQSNQGPGAARNLAIRATTAEFLAFLDADDRWLPDFLREQLAMFDRHPELDVAYTDGMLIGQTRLAGRKLSSEMRCDAAVTLEALLAQRCSVRLSATVARRAAVVRSGLFDPDLRRGQDFDLWLRMARDGARFAHQGKVLMLRRVHDENLSGNQRTQIERALRVLDKTLRTMMLSDAERRAAEGRVAELEAARARELGKELLQRGQYTEAYTALLRAAVGPANWKIRATLIGLRVAPQLVRRLYLARAAASPES
jgi:glycosyltransferase involved in cell wall biosynthesis